MICSGCLLFSLSPQLKMRSANLLGPTEPGARSPGARSPRAPPPPTSRPAGPRSRSPPRTSRQNPPPSPPASSPLMSQVSAVTDALVKSPQPSIVMNYLTKPLKTPFLIMDQLERSIGKGPVYQTDIS